MNASSTEVKKMVSGVTLQLDSNPGFVTSHWYTGCTTFNFHNCKIRVIVTKTVSWAGCGYWTKYI